MGNRKLEDGNLCKTCARKLSPWFDDRRHSTVEQIEEQLAYREENRKKLAEFHVTRSFGESRRVLLDEDAGLFLVTDETKAAVTCPWCGATTRPNAGGCCEYCGGAVNG